MTSSRGAKRAHISNAVRSVLTGLRALNKTKDLAMPAQHVARNELWVRPSERKERARIYQNALAKVDFYHNHVASFLPTDQQRSTGEAQPAHPPSNWRCHLMDLPPELRLRIYEYALTRTDTINLTRQRLSLRRGPPLLRVSCEIRKEALAAYFSRNTFRVDARILDFAAMADWLELLTKTCHPKAFTGLSFHVLDGKWSDLSQTLPLVQLIADRKIELHLGLIDVDAPPNEARVAKPRSLFSSNHTSGGYYLQLALEMAVIAGARARKEKWEEGRLVVEVSSSFKQRSRRALLKQAGRTHHQDLEMCEARRVKMAEDRLGP